MRPLPARQREALAFICVRWLQGYAASRSEIAWALGLRGGGAVGAIVRELVRKGYLRPGSACRHGQDAQPLTPRLDIDGNDWRAIAAMAGT